MLEISNLCKEWYSANPIKSSEPIFQKDE